MKNHNKEEIQERNARAIRYLTKVNPDRYAATYERGILTLFECRVSGFGYLSLVGNVFSGYVPKRKRPYERQKEKESRANA